MKKVNSVAFINPPSPFLINQRAFAPLGLLYLASYLRHSGYNVKVLDLAGKEADLQTPIRGLKADIYAVSSTTPQYSYAIKILRAVRRLHPGKQVVIGGPHPSSVPGKCLDDGFDWVIVGEGESAILRIVESIDAGLQIGRIITGREIEDIDRIPRPARDLIDIKAYGYDIDGNMAATVITSRGCPFSCAFCSKDVWKRRVRFHSPRYVFDEVRSIIDEFDIRHFLFLDDSITLDRDRLLRICSLLEPLKIRWRCYSRSRGMTRDILAAMKRAGCLEIGVGVESGSQKILDNVNKMSTVEENLEFVRLCKGVGIIMNAFLMIGLPGETRETVQETREWMEKAKPDKFGYNIFAPYLGTPIYDHPERYDIRLFKMPDRKSWVKGRQGEYSCFVQTSGLKRQEILELFYENFRYFSELTGWKPGLGKTKSIPPADGAG